MRRRLAAQIAAAVGAVAAVFLGALVILALAISDLRETSSQARESERTLQLASETVALVVDAETGVRGFIITRNEEFLEPLNLARTQLPRVAALLTRRTTGSEEDRALAVSVGIQAQSYLSDYAQGLAEAARTDPAAARRTIISKAGKRRVDTIRRGVDQLIASAGATADQRAAATADQADRAMAFAVGASIVALLSFGLLTWFLAAFVAGPIRQAARAAKRVGEGDLGIRLPEGRADEIGELGLAFNVMGQALQDSSVELEHQHAELETQNGELELQAVELESQAVELEAQSTEMQSAQAELTAANEVLHARTGELQQRSDALREAHDRVQLFARVAEEFGARPDLQARADTLLRSVADMTGSTVGAVYSRHGHGDGAICVMSRRGLSEEDLPGDALDREGVARRALEDGETVVTDHPTGDLRLRSMGEDVPVRAELHAPLIARGQTLGVLSVGRTGRGPFSSEEIVAVEHLVEQGAVAIDNALQTQRSRWLADLNRAVLNATGEGIHVVGADGRSILSNPELERFVKEVLAPGVDLTGQPPEAIAKVVADRTADPDAYRERMAQILGDPMLVAVDEYELLDTQRWVRRYTAPVSSDDGEIIGRIFVLRETTAERGAEEAKDELMATVSHELRTPLSAILGFTELLMARDYGEAERKEYLGTVHQQASRLSDLISDFLDLQRLKHGRAEIQLEPFDLHELLSQQVKLFSAQSEKHELRLRDDPAAMTVNGDPDRLRRAFANLLSNAIKYSPEGGSVVVDARRENGSMTVAVMDQGIGIPSEARDRVFDRFFRVENPATHRIGGTGLGLSLVREIVEAHGGEVGFDSVEGQGSRFWVTVPVA